jgi:hypothetical protein
MLTGKKDFSEWINGQPIAIASQAFKTLGS